MLTIADLRYLVYRWQVEACSLLAERLTSSPAGRREGHRAGGNFRDDGAMAAAGYGIKSAITHRARSWMGIAATAERWSPHQIERTYSDIPVKTNPVAERA